MRCGLLLGLLFSRGDGTVGGGGHGLLTGVLRGKRGLFNARKGCFWGILWPENALGAARAMRRGVVGLTEQMKEKRGENECEGWYFASFGRARHSGTVDRCDVRENTSKEQGREARNAHL